MANSLPLSSLRANKPPFAASGRTLPPQAASRQNDLRYAWLHRARSGFSQAVATKKEEETALRLLTMSSNKGTTFMAQTTTQMEEGSSSLSERVEAAQPNAGPHPPSIHSKGNPLIARSIPPGQLLLPATDGRSATARAWYRDDTTCVPLA